MDDGVYFVYSKDINVNEKFLPKGIEEVIGLVFLIGLYFIFYRETAHFSRFFALMINVCSRQRIRICRVIQERNFLRGKISEFRKKIREGSSHGQKSAKSQKTSERGALTDKNQRNLKKRPRGELSRTKISEISKNVREGSSHGQKSAKSQKTSERSVLTDKNQRNLKKRPREAFSRTKISET